MNDLDFWYSYGLTASTNLDITDNNSFWKLLCFTVFQYKSIRDQIWPFRKIGQGQPSVFIWINLVVLQQPMLHTNFQCYRAFGSGEGDFLRFLAHLSWRLTRWAYRMGLEPASVRPSVRASVRPCVRASTLSNMNISETSRPITTKFYLKHHWGGGKAALGFGAD